jgi:restriction system protein
MPIPDYQGFMLHLLQAVADGKEHRMRDLIREIADRAGLTDEEKKQLLPSGYSTVVANRVNWAKTYLKKAGLVSQPARAMVVITAVGRAALDKKPAKIDTEFLMAYPEFVQFFQPPPTESGPVVAAATLADTQTRTPEESLEDSFRALRADLADDLLERLRGGPSDFFEQTVVRVLVAMGYGGSLADAGQVLGKPGDEGIDGVIKEDRLGLDAIYIQAKRWREAKVGRPAVQAFVGSMEGHKARKGVFITTSAFSKEAYDYVAKIERRIVLIDGAQLAELMIDHDVGVTTAQTYAIKKVDQDFFAEDGED